jgi:hypothetical protein
MKHAFRIAFVLAAMTALEATHLDDTTCSEGSKSPPAKLGSFLLVLMLRAVSSICLVLMPTADTSTASSPSNYLLNDCLLHKVRGVTSDLLDEPNKLQKCRKGKKA